MPVHPHMRGEHVYEDKDKVNETGSSPHAWGTLPYTWLAMLLNRFIPTCVGNTRV